MLECIEALNDVGRMNNIRICWIPGHEDYLGNELADELARNGSAMDRNSTMQTVKTPLCATRESIANTIAKEHNNRWTNLQGKCEVSKLFWPSLDKSRSKKLLYNNRSNLRKLIAIFTGHNLLRKHAKKMHLTTVDECRYCKGLDSTESITHLLLECDAIFHTRFRYLGNVSQQDISELDGNTILKFLNRIGCCPVTIG